MGKDKGWVKTVSERIIRPAVMYGVEVWGEGLKDTRNMRNINAAERYSLMAMVKAYKTTSTAVLGVIAGSIPYHVEGSTRFAGWTELGIEHINQRVKEEDLAHPGWDCTSILGDLVDPDTEVWVDSSYKAGEPTGIGCITRNGGETEEHIIKAKGMPNNNLAEALAVWWALNNTVTHAKSVIMTDSEWVVNSLRKPSPHKLCNKIRKSLEELGKVGHQISVKIANRRNDMMRMADRYSNRARVTLGEPAINLSVHLDKWEVKRESKVRMMQEWQEEWTNETRGRWTYRFCSEVGTSRLGLSFKGTQLLTGHGNFGGYLSRFGLLKEGEDGMCNCGANELETVEHVWERCIREDRMEIRNAIGREAQMRENGRVIEERVARWCTWAEVLVEDDEYMAQVN